MRPWFILGLLLLSACTTGNLIRTEEVIQDEPIDQFISAQELQGLDNVKIVDIRLAWKYNAGHIPGALGIPVTEFDSIRLRAEGIRHEDRIVIYDQSGSNALSAFSIADRAGFEKVQILEGGFNSWITQEYVVEQSY